MKKLLLTATTFLLILALLAGCSDPRTEQPDNTTPSGSASMPTTEPAAETTPAATEEDIEYEGDASSYYIDVVYPQQIERYYTAVSQQWDDITYLDQEMSPVAAYYYEGNALDNVGFTFMDLDGDGMWELIIGAILNAEQDPLVFEIWTLKNDVPIMVAQSNAHNRYYLQYAEEDDLWSIAYEADNGAANHAVYYLQMCEGAFHVTQGIIFDAVANEKDPWFMTYDLDWDVSNDTPIDENTADAVMKAERNSYAAQEYFPYCLYK